MINICYMSSIARSCTLLTSAGINGVYNQYPRIAAISYLTPCIFNQDISGKLLLISDFTKLESIWLLLIPTKYDVFILSYMCIVHDMANWVACQLFCINRS